ncbi:peptidoglycan-binding domain-containing protein, partial [Ramlibacter sp.]|uniref:peptidoglycan-binding domain-containing protein n=1 Tax=Ramlibacter sp. TaxID=1917967 RepID=UPI00261CBC26
APRLGPALRAEVRAFQLAQGLPADGRPGPLTYMQLNRVSGVDEPRMRTEP